MCHRIEMLHQSYDALSAFLFGDGHLDVVEASAGLLKFGAKSGLQRRWAHQTHIGHLVASGGFSSNTTLALNTPLPRIL